MPLNFGRKQFIDVSYSYNNLYVGTLPMKQMFSLHPWNLEAQRNSSLNYEKQLTSHHFPQFLLPKGHPL